MDDKVKPHVDIDTLTHLTPKQREKVKLWTELQDVLNVGNFGPDMDKFFHPDMTYTNPNRPDLGRYVTWKVSPEEMRKRFPPAHNRLLDATGKGDDIIWVHCHQFGRHTGGKYMGKGPTGNDTNVEWFSIVTFKDNLIFNIFSIADVLGLMISAGVIDPKTAPANPYAD